MAVAGSGVTLTNLGSVKGGAGGAGGYGSDGPIRFGTGGNGGNGGNGGAAAIGGSSLSNYGSITGGDGGAGGHGGTAYNWSLGGAGGNGGTAVVVNQTPSSLAAISGSITGGAGGNGGSGGYSFGNQTNGNGGNGGNGGGAISGSGFALGVSSGSVITGGMGGAGGYGHHGGLGGLGGTAVSGSGFEIKATGGSIVGGAGGAGGYGYSPGRAGDGGAAVSGVNITLNVTGMTITGGAGGVGHWALNTSYGGGYGGKGGNGGAGVIGNNGLSLSNTSVITGGAGGAGGAGSSRHDGGAGGNGGVAVSASGGSISIDNYASIVGGAGAKGGYAFGRAGNGGAGIAVTGSATILNYANGSISGGVSGDGKVRAHAVDASGGVITLTNSGHINGDVVLDGSYANQVTLNAGSVITGSLDIGSNAASVLTLGDGPAASQLYSQAVTGTTTFAGGLVKSGTGTWIIDDNALSTLIGAAISAGTLQVGNGGNTGSIGNANVTNNGKLIFNRGDTVTFSGVISGSGFLGQAGTGTLKLTQANSAFSGSTGISAGGTLEIDNIGALGSSDVSVAGTLLVNATGVLGNLISAGTSQDGSTIAATTGNTVTLASRVVWQGPEMHFGTTTDTGTVVVGPASGSSMPDSSQLFVDGGTLRFDAQANLISKRSAGTTIATGAMLDINDQPSVSITRLSGGGTLNTGGAFDTVLTVLSGAFSGGIQGAGALTVGCISLCVPGAVTLTLGGSGLNVYSGSTTVTNGFTLQGGASNAFDATSATTVAAGGVLDLGGYDQTIGSLTGSGSVTNSGSTGATLVTNGNHSATTFSGVITDGSAATALNKVGTGTLTLEGDNTFTGGTTISAGTLQVGNGGTTGSVVGDVIDNGALVFKRSDAVTFSGVISGSGSLEQSGTGKLTLTQANTFGGHTQIVDASTLEIDNIGALGSGDVYLGGTLLANATGTLGNHIGTSLSSGAATIAATASNTLTLASGIDYLESLHFGTATDTGTVVLDSLGNVTRTASLFVDGGTLRLGQNGGFMVSARTAGTTIASGATLDVNDQSDVGISQLFGSGTVNTGAASGTVLTVGSGTFSGAIQGAGGLSVGCAFALGCEPNASTLTLGGRGLSVYAGATTITNGYTLQGGAGGTFNATSATTVAAGGVLDLGGFNQTIGSLAGSGSVTNSGSTGATLVTNGDNTSTVFSGVIKDGNAAMVLDKVGTGTLTLEGVSTFTGGTGIESGTLIVGSAAGTSAALGGNVTIDANATLGGHGRIGGDVAVQSGGHLSPGASIGTLTVDGNLVAASGSILDYEFGAPGMDIHTFGTGDSVNIGGNLELDGAVLNVTDAGGMGPGLYNVFTYGGALTETNGGIALHNTTGQVLAVQNLVAQKQINLLDMTGVALTFWNANGKADATRMGGGSGTWTTTAPVWTDAQADTTSAMQPQPGFAIFGGDAGAVAVDGSAGAVSATGMQFAVTGYTLTGDALTLVKDAGGNAPVIRVGDGTNAGAGMTATIGNVLAGSDGLTKSDAGTLVLTGANTFTGGMTIAAGTLSVASDTNLGAASGALNFNGGTLANTAAFITARDVGMIGAGTFQTDADLTLSGVVGGAGALTKTGSGTLTLNADSSAFAGTTDVQSGALVVGEAGHSDAVLGGMVNVAKGATVGGLGTLGGLDLAGTLDQGATLATPGTLRVSGNATFAQGSVFNVQARPDGTGDQLAVGGRVTIDGGSVVAIAQAGDWAPQTTYTLISAGQGVSGTFEGVNANLAFLTPVLGYGANAVSLTLQRNNINFADVAVTPNEKGVATVASGLGLGHPLYNALVKLDAPTARYAFDQASGEYHASQQTARANDSRYIREAMDQRLRAGDADPNATRQGDSNLSAWAHAWGHWDTTDSDGNAGRLADNGDGLLIGADLPVGAQGRVGVTGGASRSSLSIGSRSSWGKLTSQWLGAFGGFVQGAFALRGGIAYAWDQIPANRMVTFPGYSDQLSANVAGDTLTGFVEGAWTFKFANGSMAPFLNLAHTRVETDAGTEVGGTAALNVGEGHTDVSFSTVGARGSWWLADRLDLHGELGWQHAFGDTTPERSARFAAGPTFTVYGVPIAKDAGLGKVGLGWHVGRVSVDADYEGLFGGGMKNQAAKLTVGVTF